MFGLKQVEALVGRMASVHFFFCIFMFCESSEVLTVMGGSAENGINNYRKTKVSYTHIENLKLCKTYLDFDGGKILEALNIQQTNVEPLDYAELESGGTSVLVLSNALFC